MSGLMYLELKENFVCFADIAKFLPKRNGQLKRTISFHGDSNGGKFLLQSEALPKERAFRLFAALTNMPRICH
jgi:hypothetical protein